MNVAYSRCYREGERDKEFDWRHITYTTDHFSEILFDLVTVADGLDSFTDTLCELSEHDWTYGDGDLLKQIEKAEKAINKKAEEWADDEIFQAEIKIRLEVLRLQKGYIIERLEQIRSRIKQLQKYASILGSEEK